MKSRGEETQHTNAISVCMVLVDVMMQCIMLDVVRLVLAQWLSKKIPLLAAWDQSYLTINYAAVS